MMFNEKRNKKISVLLLITFMLTNFVMFNNTQVVKADTIAKTLDIVEITDFHGQLLDSKNNQVGAALAYQVEQIRNSNPNTLVIGGGDLYQGTPVSNVLYGVPVQKVLNTMGMEVTTLGNHEFDWGLDKINNTTMNGAKYEIVCANLYNKGKDERPYQPYKIIEKDGVKIAVIGAILNDVASIVLPANIANYDVKDAATEINACADKIRKNNEADVVVTVIHDGGDSLNNIVSKLKGVDAIFGGHTHTSYDNVATDNAGISIPVLNAACQGKGYIDLKISLDANNKIVGYSSKGNNWQPLSVKTDTPVDSDCKQIVEDAYTALKPTFEPVIGTDDVAYTKEQKDSPFGESQLGNWMADVVRAKADADVGIVNNGGIRMSPVPAGDITVGTIFYLMPFDNTVTTVNMTGAQLKTVIEQGIVDNGKGLQVSGVKITYDSSKPSYVKAVTDSNGSITTPEVPGQRVISMTREKDGTTIKDSDVIKVAAPDFVGTGGDDFTEFALPEVAKTYVDSHNLVRDALIENVKINKKIAVTMNERLKNQNSASTGTATEMTIKEAKAAVSTKASAKITGYVGGVNGTTVFLQDDPASPTAGIAVYNKSGASVSKGDKITVTGSLSTHNGVIQVTPASNSDIVKISSNNTITPKEVTIGQINDDLQGELIKVKNASFVSIDNNNSSTIKDSTGSVVIYKMPVIAGLNVNDVKDVTAVVSKYNTTTELIVSDASDVTDCNQNSSSKATISIVATSDVHGSVLNFDYGTNSATSKGQGLAKVSTYVNNLRAANPNVMLIDNGDTIQGTPLVYYYNMIDKTSLYPMAKVMGAMKYDTETIGNHEYNYGLDNLKRVINDYKNQGMHVLSGNTYKADNSNFADAYYIKEFNINGKAVKVGIIGLTTKCISSWEDPKHYEGLHFNDIVEEAKKYVPIVKGQGADVVIVAAHSGEEGASDVIPENQIKALATNVSGIDAIVAGHAHSVLNDVSLKNPEGKVVPVVEPGKSAAYISQIDIGFDSNGAVTGVSSKSVAMDKTIAEDPNIVSLIAPYQEKTLQYTSTVIGQATGAFSGKGQTIAPTAIMELINKVQATGANAQLSIAAPLSASANIPEGDITIKDVMGTYVFENYLYGIKMTGEQVKKWLEYSARYYKQVSNKTDAIEKDPVLNVPDYNLDQLYGATYNIDLTKPVGSRIVNLKYNGNLIKDSDVFTVAINDYRYNGGGGFMKAAGISNTDSSIVTYSSAKALGDDGQIRSLMLSYIKDNKIINPVCANNWKLSTESVAQDSTNSSSSRRSKHTTNSNDTDSSNSSDTANSSKDTNSSDNTNNTNGSDNTNSSSNDTNNNKNNSQETAKNNNSTKNDWVQADSKWYYMDQNGTKIKNTWKNIGDVWYYFNEDCSMKTGWYQDVNSKWYYLQENGAMKTGWFLDKDENWYYLQENGSMMTGWYQDNNGEWYYLKENGAMAKSEEIDGYYVNENGEWAA